MKEIESTAISIGLTKSSSMNEDKAENKIYFTNGSSITIDYKLPNCYYSFEKLWEEYVLPLLKERKKTDIKFDINCITHKCDNPENNGSYTCVYNSKYIYMSRFGRRTYNLDDDDFFYRKIVEVDGIRVHYVDKE